jgi:DNA polymerase III epsilon subunit-like protein
VNDRATDHSHSRQEVYIVVDVEASGPSPGCYALLSIGACTLDEPRHTFYVELQPDTKTYTPEAMAISQLSLDRLAAEGLPAADALQAFADWIDQVVPEGAQPVFTAFNAPFDWMFVNDYFHRYLGHNPLGHKALDIKAYFMGLHGVAWAETSYAEVSDHYFEKCDLTHHALSDAINSADAFQAMLDEAAARRSREAM